MAGSGNLGMASVSTCLFASTGFKYSDISLKPLIRLMFAVILPKRFPSICRNFNRRWRWNCGCETVFSPSLLSQPVSSAPDTIYLSDNCVRKMKEIQSSEPEKNLLRLGVDSGGCAGYKYVFKFVTTTNSDDRVFEKDGVKLVVDSFSYDRVRGATVDYEEELISSAFVVAKNPKAKACCGCHKSFTFID